MMKVVLSQIQKHIERFDSDNINDLIDMCLEKQMSLDNGDIFTGMLSGPQSKHIT